MKMINKDSWKEVKIGDYVDHIEVNERNPERRKYSDYVSVEHISILDLRINGVASEEQPSFNRTFKQDKYYLQKDGPLAHPILVKLLLQILTEYVHHIYGPLKQKVDYSNVYCLLFCKQIHSLTMLT
jgi:hypothetical protein